jgi:hypothetical protein
MKTILLTNHKIEIRNDGKVINIRTYYKDANGMWQHMGDQVMSLGESIKFTNSLKEVQDLLIM